MSFGADFSYSLVHFLVGMDSFLLERSEVIQKRNHHKWDYPPPYMGLSPQMGLYPYLELFSDLSTFSSVLSIVLEPASGPALSKAYDWRLGVTYVFLFVFMNVNVCGECVVKR